MTAWPKLGTSSATASALSKEVPNNVSNLIHEINLHNDKKCNLIIQGFPQSSICDELAVDKILADELHYTGGPIASCIRLGKPGGTKPQLLLVSMSSDDDVTAVMRSASSLHSSSNALIAQHVFINWDLTVSQRKEQFDLRAERRRRVAAGELNLVIRHGTIQKRSTSAISGGTAAASSFLGASVATGSGLLTVTVTTGLLSAHGTTSMTTVRAAGSVTMP